MMRALRDACARAFARCTRAQAHALEEKEGVREEKHAHTRRAGCFFCYMPRWLLHVACCMSPGLFCVPVGCVFVAYLYFDAGVWILQVFA